MESSILLLCQIILVCFSSNSGFCGWLIFLRHFSFYPVLSDLLPLLLQGADVNQRSMNVLSFCGKCIYTQVNPEIKAV